jgi:hypothetical protein
MLSSPFLCRRGDQEGEKERLQEREGTPEGANGGPMKGNPEGITGSKSMPVKLITDLDAKAVFSP